MSILRMILVIGDLLTLMRVITHGHFILWGCCTESYFRNNDFMGSSPLLNELRAVIRLRNYSIRTEYAYVSWIKRYILFHHKRHPNEMHDAEVVAFLSYLAVKRNVSASNKIRHLMHWSFSIVMLWPTHLATLLKRRAQKSL